MVGRLLLRLVVIAGLAVDVYVHWDLASNFDTLRGSGSPSISQGELFRVETVIALVVMVLVAVWHRRWTAGLAFLVAGGGVAVVLLYRYVNVGAIGPLPNMYDPTWYTEKTVSAVAEGAAAVAALLLLFLEPRASGLRRRAGSS
jgi:hypothetical protein